MKNVRELAKRRKTVRKFSGRKVSLEDILYCIETAKEAPSGMNAQPWRFLIISDREKKALIRKVCEEGERKFHERLKGELGRWVKEKGITWEKEFLESAPFLVLVFSNKKFRYFIQSVWLSIGYFLLALEEKGLATVTYTPPNLEDIKKLLNIPDNFRLETILPVGYSADEKKKEPRNTLEEVVFLEEWDK
jgi:nitroreductase